MPERDSQELSLIPCGSRPFSSALSCGSATPNPYASNASNESVKPDGGIAGGLARQQFCG